MKPSITFRNRTWSTLVSTIAAGGLLFGVAAILDQAAVAKDRRGDRDRDHRCHGEPCQSFEEIWMTLEQNATDGDTEVVLFAKTETDGLARLTITAPDGRRIAQFKGDDDGVGLREFHLESAEPPDLDAVLDSFPEGTYKMEGRTVNGDCVFGTAVLSHDIAPSTELLTPAEEQVVPIDQVVLSWVAVASAERYVIELNNEDNGSEFTFQVFPPTTSLAIPAALLQAGSEYQFGVGVKTDNGNITFVETTFFTAP